MRGIWIDRQKIKIFHKENGSYFVANRIDLSPNENCSGAGSENLSFQKAAKALKGCAWVFLLGPGIGLHNFRTYLMEQHPLIARRVLVCEQMDEAQEETVPELLLTFELGKAKKTAALG